MSNAVLPAPGSLDYKGREFVFRSGTIAYINIVEFEFPPGHTHHTAWLDPELPATFEAVEEVLAGVAAIFRGPYIHIGRGRAPRDAPRPLLIVRAAHPGPRPLDGCRHCRRD